MKLLGTGSPRAFGHPPRRAAACADMKTEGAVPRHPLRAKLNLIVPTLEQDAQ